MQTKHRKFHRSRLWLAAVVARRARDAGCGGGGDTSDRRQQRADHDRHLAAAHRRLLAAGQGREAGL